MQLKCAVHITTCTHCILVFPHFMNSCLSCCHQRPVPTEPCGANPSQHLGQSPSPPQAPDTVQGAFSSRPSATTHVHPAPSPLLCQHSAQPHAEPGCGTDPAGSLPVCKRHRAVSQSGQACSPAYCVGVSGVSAPAHWCQPPAPQMGEVPSKPEQQDFASSLHSCKLLACTTAEQRKVSPIRSICVSHNPSVGCYEESGSSNGRLCLRL